MAKSEQNRPKLPGSSPCPQKSGFRVVGCEGSGLGVWALVFMV